MIRKAALIFPLFLLLAALFFSSCSTPTTKDKPIVVVSMPPFAYMVKKIAGNTVETEIALPPNTDPHLFEPSPKDMLRFVGVKLFIGVGEHFEKKMISVLKENNKQLHTLNLVKSISLAKSSNNAHPDTHIWTSPKLCITEATAITQALSHLYPKHKHLYEKNLKSLIDDLEDLDEEIQNMLKPVKNRAFLISHPSLAYFATEYNFKQVSVQIEGKSARIRDLEKITHEIQEIPITVALTQKQFDNQGVQMFAEKFHLHTYPIDALEENFPEALLEIARVILEGSIK